MSGSFYIVKNTTNNEQQFFIDDVEACMYRDAERKRLHFEVCVEKDGETPCECYTYIESQIITECNAHADVTHKMKDCPYREKVFIEEGLF